jgi:hypothetical protein
VSTVYSNPYGNILQVYITLKRISLLTMMNVVFWDVTLCGSCKSRLFGETYRFHPQGEKNTRTRNNVSSNSTLRRINRYMRKEAIKWDVLHDGWERGLHITVSLVSCLSITADILCQAVASRRTLSIVAYMGAYYKSKG